MYRKWAKANNFESMLKVDVEARKKEAEASAQTVIDDHAVPVLPKERVLPYSDELFEQAAIEWLIETDQV
jgi:hypothetical protein